MFQTAERIKYRLLMAITGPAGSGKTVTSMKIMSYLLEGEPFFMIDTENGRSLQYSVAPGETPDPEERKFNFQIATLTDYNPKNYITAIDEAIEQGAKGIIIDSLSHAWAGKGGVLDLKAKKDMQGGNSYTNWSAFTQLQNSLIEKIMQLPIHVIVTMRSKTEYSLQQNAAGKSVPVKIGQAPVQRDDLEFNFDIVIMMNHDHGVSVMKDTSGLLEDEEFTRPGIDFVKTILPWLNTGTRLPMTKIEFIEKMKKLDMSMEDIASFVKETPEINGIFKWDDLYKIKLQSKS